MKKELEISENDNFGSLYTKLKKLSSSFIIDTIECIENGLICRPLGPSIVLCPPFITTEDEMGIIFETLDKTLSKVFDEVKSLG